MPGDTKKGEIMYDDEVAKVIEDFPNYEVTNYGRIFNLRTGREMILSPLLNGELTVGMTRDHWQYRRSVKRLVAQVFVPGESEFFNTPILLDGDRNNVRADNLVWRPRWFACEYARQFTDQPEWYFYGPILDTTNHIEYPHVFAAAVENGLLCTDIRKAITTGRPVFPSRDVYVHVPK